MNAPSTSKSTVAVIGGGAAGYFAAIICAETNPQLQVLLLEATPRLLTKVKISGGGRCNVTHHCFEVATLITNYPRGFQELRGPFSRFQPRDTVAWFEARGVPLKVEGDGRMFPTSDNSESIIECLKSAAAKAGVEVRTGAFLKEVERVRSPVRPEEKFRLSLQDGSMVAAKQILLATGSAPIGYQVAKSLGHQIIDPVPSLFTFEINDPLLADLSGVSFPKVDLTLKVGADVFRQSGPLLITHWGLSGPAVLKLSAWGARALHRDKYAATLTVSFTSGIDLPKTVEELKRMKVALHGKTVKSVAPYELTKRFWQRLVEHAGIAAETSWEQLSHALIDRLGGLLSQCPFAVKGKGPFKEEFVTAGGVNLREVNFKSMESRICPGLFFAGEILDIDGITGGFNFQNAWTTGWIAGNHLATDGGAPSL